MYADPAVELHTARTHSDIHTTLGQKGHRCAARTKEIPGKLTEGVDRIITFSTPPEPPPTLGLHTLKQPLIGPTHIFSVRRPNLRVQETIVLDEQEIVTTIAVLHTGYGANLIRFEALPVL